jgi:hypothetical protein
MSGDCPCFRVHGRYSRLGSEAAAGGGHMSIEKRQSRNVKKEPAKTAKEKKAAKKEKKKNGKGKDFSAA